MKIVRALLVVLLAGVTVSAAQEQPAANPQTKTPVITKRQANQRARIRQGVRSGELTRGEAARLRAKERKIQAEKKAAKSDGTVTQGERRHLKREENRTSRQIYRLKHNNRERPKAK
jgi:hypothetical protein